jgi:AcrR family transcriptional regulator
MPRAGLSSHDVVAAGTEVADEAGFQELTMRLLAQRLGIRPPSLYKHVSNLADLRHRIATQATTELGEAGRDALQGSRRPPAASTPSPPRSAATASATRRWCTPSAPSAAPSMDSRC